MHQRPNIKEHLVNLLFEEFKQQAFFDDLDKIGLTLSKGIVVKNWDIVADIIGFPRDNTLQYDFDYINSGGELRDKNKKLPDEYMFCRDWLYNDYFDSTNDIAKEQKIYVNDKGLHIEEYLQEEIIKEKLLKHIDWLFDQYEKFIKGELD